MQKTSNRHIANSLCRSIYSCDCRNRDKQKNNAQRGNWELPHSRWKMPRNKEIIQRFAKRQANSTTNNAPQNSIGGCFTSNHFRHLPFIHSYCPHSSILLHSGRHTHGNAIDDVHYRYQCNNRQKRMKNGCGKTA